MELTRWLAVFVGAGIGACLRYAAGLAVPLRAGFPWATFGINLSGSLLIGVLAAAFRADSPGRAFWIVGLLGGFTTFSTFSLEALQLIERRQPLLAAAYMGASAVLGLLACALGWRIGQQLYGP